MIGAPLVASGEMVFSTGMVGYPETLTDPSYFGQVLAFTYPHVGNYGVPRSAPGETPAEGFESGRIQVSAVVLGVESSDAFHWQSAETLDEWFRREGVPGIVGIDTRRLVHSIRSAPEGLLGRVVPDASTGIKKLPAYLPAPAFDDFFSPSEYNLLPAVSTERRIRLGKGKTRIGVIDCGAKWSIIRRLERFGCEVEVLPWDTKLGTVDCDGWVITNGPGDPTKAEGLSERIRGLLGDKRPILGICLGHQLLSLAVGASTQKMRYGHRSHNQPVIDLSTRRAYLTSQNHGYVVLRDSIPPIFDPWFVNANDGSIEGIRHRSLPISSVQFHPEAAAGPRDTAWVLRRFVEQVRSSCP